MSNLNPSVTEQVEQWLGEAFQLGCEHARNAASWITDGNESQESREHKLALMETGDPLMDSYMPRCPNLSGEMADDPTPQRLACDIAGADIEKVEDESWLIDALADAYEKGVDETFYPACEAELRKWLDD